MADNFENIDVLHVNILLSETRATLRKLQRAKPTMNLTNAEIECGIQDCYCLIFDYERNLGLVRPYGQ